MEGIRVWFSLDTPSEFYEKLIGLSLTKDPLAADVHILYVNENFSKDSFDYNVVMQCKARNILVLVASNGCRQFIPSDLIHQGVYNLRSKAKIQQLIEALNQPVWQAKPLSKEVVKKNNTLADARKAKEEAEKLQKKAKKQLKKAKEAADKILEDAKQRKQEIIEEGHIEATPDELLCQICFEKPKNSIFLHGTDGHKFGCYECSIQCDICPVCRAPFDRVYKIFDV
jgi:rubrerythrin